MRSPPASIILALARVQSNRHIRGQKLDTHRSGGLKGACLPRWAGAGARREAFKSQILTLPDGLQRQGVEVAYPDGWYHSPSTSVLSLSGPGSKDGCGDRPVFWCRRSPAAGREWPDAEEVFSNQNP